MSLAGEYRRQLGWRRWPALLDALPPLTGETVFDLGCGPGDVTALLRARGARAIGFDMNPELLPQGDFRLCDLTTFPDPGVRAGGIWCSFTAAYLPDLPAAIASWARHLSGWMALTEIDDLFAHQPLSHNSESLLSGFIAEALRENRYDFQMGRKLRAHLERAGFTVEKELSIADDELAFQGPARPEIVDAWRERFARMKKLAEFCGSDFAALRDEFLHCLTLTEHRSSARVVFCLAWNLTR
jgi:SAM-dependent methyltransferase